MPKNDPHPCDHERATTRRADDLGGVLGVWGSEDEEGNPVGLVEVVNFYNPYRPRANPAAAAIRNAVPLDDATSVKYVRLPDLVALKIYAGRRRDLADIGELLVKNPDADRDEIRATAKPFDHNGDLERLIEEASIRIANGDFGS